MSFLNKGALFAHEIQRRSCTFTRFDQYQRTGEPKDAAAPALFADSM